MTRFNDPFASSVRLPVTTAIRAIAPVPAASAPIGPIEIDLKRHWPRSASAAFCKVRDEWGLFSNFASCRVEAGGAIWRSSEALYQALRFPGAPDVQRRIQQARSAFDAKAIARANVGLQRRDWLGVNLDAMGWTLCCKRDASLGFAGLLRRAACLEIVEISVRDSFWGAKPSPNGFVGGNALGQLLGRVRDGQGFAPPPGSLLFGRPLA